MTTPTQCNFDGCTATTKTPLTDGWMQHYSCRGGFPDGWYCPAHTAWLAATPPDAMTTTNTKRIVELNDRFRRATGNSDPAGASLGRKFMTRGIRNLGLMTTIEIAEKVQAFDRFNADNDPYGGHDFGSFEHGGDKIFWKIDYYDRASFGTGQEIGSEDPSDPLQTLRILTIMLASEY